MPEQAPPVASAVCLCMSVSLLLFPSANDFMSQSGAAVSFALADAARHHRDRICKANDAMRDLLKDLDARVDLTTRATTRSRLRLASVFHFTTRRRLTFSLSPWCVDPEVTYASTAKTCLSLSLVAPHDAIAAVSAAADAINKGAVTSPLVLDEPRGPTYTVARVQKVHRRTPVRMGLFGRAGFDAALAAMRVVSGNPTMTRMDLATYGLRGRPREAKGYNLDLVEWRPCTDAETTEGALAEDVRYDPRQAPDPWVRLRVDLLDQDVATNHDLVVGVMADLAAALGPCPRLIPQPDDPHLAVD